MPSLFLQDGYTLDGRIPPMLPLHGEVRFKYRPAQFRQRLAYQAAPPDKADQVGAKIICEHLIELTHDGEAVELTPQDAVRLCPPIFQGLLFHVLAFDATAEAGNSRPG